MMVTPLTLIFSPPWVSSQFSAALGGQIDQK